MEQIPQNRSFISGGMEPCLKKYLEISPDFDYNSGIVILVRKVFLLNQSTHRLNSFLCRTFIQAIFQFILRKRPVHPVAHQQNLIAGKRETGSSFHSIAPGSLARRNWSNFHGGDLRQPLRKSDPPGGPVESNRGRNCAPGLVESVRRSAKGKCGCLRCSAKQVPRFGTRQATKVEPPLDGQLWSAASTFSIAC